MSKKKTSENILLVPGESGWEIWTGSESGFNLATATDTHNAADLTGIPGGEITLLFPVKAITAIPMRVASDDEALFSDLAALHAERLGLRPDPMAGQLTDQFVIAKDTENSALLSVLLRVPGEGELPTRGPKEFDISARAMPLEGDSLAVWKEFGRWVFALSHLGKLVYCQATSFSSGSPDEALAREVRLSLIQLSHQGIDLTPTRIQIWSKHEAITSGALGGAFGNIPVTISPRPAPLLPSPRSKLLPADVRAARKIAQRRQNIMLAVAAVILAYIGILGWFGYGLWKDSSETKKLNALAEQAAPEGRMYSQHVEKWDELAPAIDLSNSPVEILKNIQTCMAVNSGLRLRTAEISAMEITLIGEAQQPAVVNQFSLALGKSNELANFDWEKPEPQQTSRGWEFTYKAINSLMRPPAQ